MFCRWSRRGGRSTLGAVVLLAVLCALAAMLHDWIVARNEPAAAELVHEHEPHTMRATEQSSVRARLQKVLRDGWPAGEPLPFMSSLAGKWWFVRVQARQIQSKFLMALHALRLLFADAEYYLLTDDDTFVVVPPLLLTLRPLPSGLTHPLFYGEPADRGSGHFHGGAGLLISRALLAGLNFSACPRRDSASPFSTDSDAYDRFLGRCLTSTMSLVLQRHAAFYHVSPLADLSLSRNTPGLAPATFHYVGPELMESLEFVLRGVLRDHPCRLAPDGKSAVDTRRCFDPAKLAVATVTSSNTTARLAGVVRSWTRWMPCDRHIFIGERAVT